MKHFSIKKIAVTLPSVFLEGANWADAYEFSPISERLDALEAARAMFDTAPPPLWVRCLNESRNRIVGLFDIKPGQISIDETAGGAFPLLSRSEDVVVYGFDDWHLDFRVVIQVHDADAGRAVRLTTLVRRRNSFGYGYIFLITPFHLLIVRRLLRNLSSR
ncbi:DUF2867 domain-containing protein [Rhodovulum sulfidophilum]|uniref:DUF2867 domain-containing protein n=1 Tax=Rhodovulum sulfidophilum TaxID=35806 RepID=UPI00138A43E0|nr:DUF2867 domain-containing protein [Rhodovulum sulfidophilum]NDK35498.1 DUF2867 domain-containing protein [Rhodovulum sulfidophilum]